MVTQAADPPPAFVGLSAEKQREAIETVHKQRQDAIALFLETDRAAPAGKGDRTPYDKAMRQLGYLRAAEAVDVLVEHIDFYYSDTPAAGTRGAGLDDYPAMAALSDIGMPAVTVLQDRLAREEDKLKRAMMCEVIRNVLGTNLGHAMLTDQIKSHTLPADKEHLQLALTQFDSDRDHNEFPYVRFKQ